MSEASKKESFVEQTALQELPKEQRKSWVSIALIWAGAMICVPSLMVGGTLVTGLSLGKAILAGVVGYGIVVLYMLFQGMQGTDLGRPTVVNASSAFGERGSQFIISFVLGVSVMGWFGVQANVTGAAFSGILQQWLGKTIPVPLSSAIWGIIMLVTSILGYKALAYLNYIAVPALIILAVYGTSAAIGKYGIETLANMKPTAPFSFFQGIAVSVGSFAVGGVIAGDYSRYAHNRKDSLLSTVLGVLPFGVLMVIAGALMAAVAGTADMTQVVTALGFPVLGLLILILATWTTNAVNAYSGGIALTNLFHLSDSKRPLATAIAGLVGTALAISGILNYFIPFLLVLTAGICPIAGVMIADYWIVLKGKRENWKPLPGVNIPGVISLLAGFAVAYFVAWGSQPINGIVVSGVLYVILSAVIKRK